MTDDTLAKALTDVRQRRSDLQAEHERLTSELAKLRAAEASLASIVEGAPLGGSQGSPRGSREEAGYDGQAPSGRTGRRGPRGPRANSAKGRLKALLDEAGPQGLTHAEITRRLPDVSPATLGAYLSGLSTSGEVARSGDFYRSNGPTEADADDDAAEDAEEGASEAAEPGVKAE